MNASPLPPAHANLTAHALADMFPMIGEGPEFEGLKASIAIAGIREPIKLFEGKILDGRNRFKAAIAIGHKLTPANFEEFKGTLGEAEQYVIDTNVHRRHLSAEAKADLVRRMLAKYPTKSDRKIAQLCGVSHPFVSKLRKPEGDPAFDKFAKNWDDLSDQQRKSFVAKFAPDLRELLA